MSDGQRRERPKFEPPPWEREAFDRLERRRAEEAAAEPGSAATPGSTPEPGESAERPAPPPVPGAFAPAAVAPSAPKASPDEAQVASMLEQLRVEETDPPVSGRLAMIAGAITAVIGAAMTVSGLVSLERTHSGLPLLGAVVVIVFGLGFLGLGVWVWMGSQKAKGSR